MGKESASGNVDTRPMTAFLVVAVLMVGCAHRPIEEMSLADVALKAAQRSKADALAPDLFRKAENHFLRAKKDYSEGYFDSSRKHATEARIYAEKAEFESLKRQSQLRSQKESAEEVPKDPEELGSSGAK